MIQSATEYQIRDKMFEALYDDYQKPIERYLFAKWVHNQDIAADLCQETFKQLWELLRKETVVKQYAYYKNRLYQTATHRAIDYSRHNGLIVFQSLSESEANGWLDEPVVEGHENWICDRHWLREVLAQMPLRHQQCVLLKDYGYKQKKIAEILDISEAAVSEIMRDVKTQLRKYYPVTADLKRVYEGMDIELLLKSIHKYEHERLLRLTMMEQLDDLSEFKKPPGWQYTREQVRYIDFGQFGKEVFEPDPLVLDFVYPDDNDDVVLVARPSELVIVRGAKQFRNCPPGETIPTQPWGKTISTKQITTRPTIEVN